MTQKKAVRLKIMVSSTVYHFKPELKQFGLYYKILTKNENLWSFWNFQTGKHGS